MNKPPNFLYVQEAMEIFGVSDTTIRRLCKKGMKGADFKYIDNKLIILEDFLYKYYKPLAGSKSSNGREEENKFAEIQGLFKDLMQEYPAALLIEKDKRIKDLQKIVETKDNAIEELMHINTMLVERNREQNIIIQSIQDKLTRQLAPENSQNTNKIATKVPETIGDKILIGVAIVSAIALIGFIGMMVFAYLSN
jgi:hypothetical protein